MSLWMDDKKGLVKCQFVQGGWNPLRSLNISVSSLRNTDDKDPNPWDEMVRLCDRESLP